MQMERLRSSYGKIFSKKLGTFQTTVTDKKTENSEMIIGGGTLWVPSTALYLILENGKRINVDTRTFNRINIGDVVWVSEYSNGSCRLHYH